MSGWFAAFCQALAPVSGTTLAIMCALLAALLAILIALGFGPLRPWLGGSTSTERPTQHGWVEEQDGVRSMWQLYRHLKRGKAQP